MATPMGSHLSRYSTLKYHLPLNTLVLESPSPPVSSVMSIKTNSHLQHICFFISTTRWTLTFLQPLLTQGQVTFMINWYTHPRPLDWTAGVQSGTGSGVSLTPEFWDESQVLSWNRTWPIFLHQGRRRGLTLFCKTFPCALRNVDILSFGGRKTRDWIQQSLITELYPQWFIVCFSWRASVHCWGQATENRAMHQHTQSPSTDQKVPGIIILSWSLYPGAYNHRDTSPKLIFFLIFYLETESHRVA